MAIQLVITRSGVPPITLSVSPTTTIAELKQRLFETQLSSVHRPPPPDQQHLLFAGQMLGEAEIIGDVLQSKQVRLAQHVPAAALY